MENRKPVVEFNNFTFQYFTQAEPTLHNINLTIYEGEKVVIVGPSGSGKSTLGNCLNGLIPFSFKGKIDGSLKICGLETKDQSIFLLSKKVGTVLQDPDGQFIGLSSGEDIAFALENQCISQPEMKSIVEKTADMVGIKEILTNSPFELSGGQKQRVSLAGVMVNDEEVLLFDEPLANLDPATGKRVIELIDDVKRKYNKTVIIIEHRLEDVLYKDVDRIIVVSDGKIAAVMNPHEIMATSILPDLGIREPLYVTALKYAGVNVTKEMQAGYISTLDIDAVKDKVQNFALTHKDREQSDNSEVILSGKNISFSYTERKEILKGIDFEIKQGEMVSIVGTNGAGKTTLARAISGLVKNVKGNIIYNGVQIEGTTISERAKYIGYVMQNPNQMICKPMIFDEVALGLRLRKTPEDEIKQCVEDALKVCGLYEFRNWPIAALSFGQKKRVTIASMLVLEPKVLILDEPTAGQDYYHYTEIMEFLYELNKKGITIILITHDMHLMLEYTDHALVVHDGKIIFDGTSVEALTTEDIADKASLKITSLYELAKCVGLTDAQKFVYQFIDYERSIR